jgi:serine/threonine-protein kinase
MWQKAWFRRSVKIVVSPILVLTGLILLVDKMAMPLVTRHGQEISAPTLVGRSLEDAQGILKAIDGTIEIIERRFSPDHPDGVIIEQRPGPGTPIKEGRVFRLVVSRGSQLIDVPRVRGQTIRQAELILQEAGFIVGGRAMSEDASLPKGTVVGTIPGSGSRLPRLAVVNLLVNAELRNDYTWCPNLAGLNIEEARVLLRERKLLVGRIDRRYNPDVDPGTVIEQSLVPGEELPLGTEIDLVISRE